MSNIQPLFKRDKDIETLYKILGILEKLEPMVENHQTCLRGNNGNNKDVGLVGSVASIKNDLSKHLKSHLWWFGSTIALIGLTFGAIKLF